MSSTSLTEDQRAKIEENKRKALAKRAEKQALKQLSTRTSIHSNAQTQTGTSTILKKSNTVQYPSYQNIGIQETSTGKNTITCETFQNRVSQNKNIHTTVSKQNDEVRTHSNSDGASISRIEENKQRALALREEKKKLSPDKGSVSNLLNGKQTTCLKAGNEFSKTFYSKPLPVGNKESISKYSSLEIIKAPERNSTKGYSFDVSHTHGKSHSNSVISKLNAQNNCILNNVRQDSGRTSNADGSDVLWKDQNAFCKLGGKKIKGSCVLESRDRFVVKVTYCAPLVEVFKAMETKIYDAASRNWSFSLSEYDNFLVKVRALQSIVDVDPLPKAITQVFSRQLKGEKSVTEIPEKDLSKIDKALVDALMPFQRTGVNFGIHKNGRLLLADDMGLGKTIQAICLACYYRDEWPLLIVVPSSVRFDWAQQIQRWVPSVDPQSIRVVLTSKESVTSDLICIVSYDLMARKAEELKRCHYQVIIMDECHLLKNFKTARCKAAMPLLQNSRRVILLSGTPALSRPSELYTQIQAVCPFLFKYHDFGVRYCDGKQNVWGWDFSGSSNMTELQLLLEEKVMIRRLKKNVIKQLPSKFRQVVFLDPASIKISKDLKRASKTMDHKNLKGMERRGALLDYFHESGRAKIQAVRDYVIDLIESERKFLIFAHHQEVLDAIEDVVRNKIESGYIRIDGRTNPEQRNHFCKKFQEKERVRVAILSITAANAGLNLSAANLVLFAELFWNPGILVQAEDRAHRIGQQDNVTVQYLIAKQTADDHIWPLVQTKLSVLSKAGLSKDDFSTSDTTMQRDSKQKDITDYFEESFFEDADFDVSDSSSGWNGGNNILSLSEKNKTVKSDLKEKDGILKYFNTPIEDPTNTSGSTKETEMFTETNIDGENEDFFTEDLYWDDDFPEPEAKKMKV